MKNIKRVLGILAVSMLLACSVFAAGGNGTGGGTGAGTGGGTGAGGNKETTAAVESTEADTTAAETPAEETSKAPETPTPGTGGGVRPLSVVSVKCDGADLSGATVAASGTITVKFSNGMATYAEDTKKVIKIDGKNFPTAFDPAYKNDFVVSYTDLEPGAHGLTIGKNAMSNNGQTLEAAYTVRFEVEGEIASEETTPEETTPEVTEPAETTPEETTAEVTTPEESKEVESSIVENESKDETLESSKTEESEKETSKAPVVSDKDDTPNTGDHNMAAVYVIVFLASACGLVLFNRKRRA